MVIIINIQESGLFQSEEADRLLESSKGLIDEITSSEGFQDAKEAAEDLGKDIQESGAWESFKNAVADFFKAIVDFFRSLFYTNKKRTCVRCFGLETVSDSRRLSSRGRFFRIHY